MKPFRTTAAAAALLFAAGAARAQGPDARVLPRGVLEVRVHGIFTGYDERFGGGRDPLGSGFEALLRPRTEALAAPGVAALRGALAAAGGAADTASLTAGSVQALLSGDARDVPLSLSLGLTRRLTVEATLPIVRRETAVRGIFLEGGTVGVNPNTAQNASVLTQFGTEFQALGRSGLLPVQGTAAATEFIARVRARSQSAADSILLPTRGVSISELLNAENDLTPAEADALTLRSANSSYQLGDLQVGARFRLAGNAPGWGLPADSTFVRGFRAVVGARVRLPTGRSRGALFLLEEPALRGHFGVGGDVAGDWFPSRRWWVTGAAETEVLFGSNVTRLAFTEDTPFPDTTRLRVLRREPGAAVAASLTPRFRLTQDFSFAAQYRFQTSGAVEYTGDGAERIGPLESVTARTAHRLGVGASYSTVAGYAAGRVPFPADVSLMYGRTVAGSGGAPADTRLELAVRAYYPVFGRPQRAAPATPAAPPAPADTTRRTPL